MTEATMELDCKGLNCPMPILKAKKAIKGLNSGDILKVLATDPGSVKDFDAFCRSGGHKLLENGDDGGVFFYFIEKG